MMVKSIKCKQTFCNANKQPEIISKPSKDRRSNGGLEMTLNSFIGRVTSSNMSPMGNVQVYIHSPL